MIRRCLIFATLLAVPSAAHAQFATFIPPKPKVPDSVASVVAAAQKAKADSATAARIANMKTWVDSAAGLPPRPAHRADTVLAPIDTAGPPPVLVATARRSTPTPTPASTTPASAPAPSRSSQKGIRAPATASDLPFLLVVGLSLVALGVVLITGAPREGARAHA